MKRLRHFLPALAAALALAACGGDGPSDPPRNPGQVSAVLVSPNGAEGAALVELTGAGVRDVMLVGGQAFVQAGNPARVLLVLGTPGEVRFSVLLDDKASVPTARVLEVSDGGNNLRPSLDGYRVDVTP